MAVSMIAQLLAATLMSSAAQDSSAPAAAPPAAQSTCGSPIYDPKHDCAVIATGSARLQCLVMADGSLQSCTVVSEDPPGKGFGEAALASAARTHVKPDPNRPATGMKATIPFNFKPDE